MLLRRNNSSGADKYISNINIIERVKNLAKYKNFKK